MSSVKKIVVFRGDHAGKEIIGSALQVLDLVQKFRPEIKLEYNFQHIGGAAIDATGSPLTDETIAACKASDAILLSAVGGPEWGHGPVRPELGLLKIRKELNLWANIRPSKFISDSLVALSPIKEEIVRGTDITILRELIGGIYFGKQVEDDGSGYACDTMPYSRPEIERIAHMGAYLAKLTNPPQPVISIDKANVLATSRMWRKTMTEIFKEQYPELSFSHQLVDSAAMIMVKTPTKLNGVMLCENLMGDILSDEASVIPGSLGLLPSASLSAIPSPGKKAIGMYEPCHGSAPDIAGKGIINPIAMILSAAMMLRLSFGYDAEADIIEQAVKKVLDDKSIGGEGLRTRDIGGQASTTEMSEAVCRILTSLLQN